MEIITAEKAASLIQDNWRLIPGGFGSCGHPDALTQAIRTRFLETGTPRNLALIFAAGPGDRKGHGIDALALEGLVTHAIGGFWGLCPELIKMARAGLVEAHNFPQGVVSKLFSAIASGVPGVLTHVGLDTFVDPDRGGGVIDGKNSTPLVEKINFRGKDQLFYPSQRVDCALLRGTFADRDGNISICDETSLMDSVAQALATKRSGGTVIVQVKKVLEPGEKFQLREVRIPGFLVDYVVVATEEFHPQTYGDAYDPSFTSNTCESPPGANKAFPLEKRLIAYRAALELKKHPKAVVNLGIGIPALIGAQAHELGLDCFTLTVESGLIGGVPQEGLSFGASKNPTAVIEQASLFDFYDGGGLDLAFLGFAEGDGDGNVNVSRFGCKVTGAGGFINISQSSKKIVFCGTFTEINLKVKNEDGKLVIVHEGEIKKFSSAVQHLTFNGPAASKQGKTVLYVTERAVFTLDQGRLKLIEIAPGITIESLRPLMDCDFIVSPDLIEMPGCDVIF